MIGDTKSVPGTGKVTRLPRDAKHGSQLEQHLLFETPTDLPLSRLVRLEWGRQL